MKKSTNYSFSKDKFLIPDRWIEDRKLLKSEDFVNQKINLGSNKDIHDTYNILIGVNIVLFIALMVLILFLGITWVASLL